VQILSKRGWEKKTLDRIRCFWEDNGCYIRIYAGNVRLRTSEYGGEK